ncbi:Gfo/Idh/MocA family protein [Cellulomonas hominis]|uniref:Gfo/Idh/MocA family protein n=1 Tax=Cellulomonas hominis TaxID=156981 RepID=UPI001B91D252|nr:Gfo/Idh/MocA family oxidoreductase [Cellulomonas hominis]VTR76586.1 1,5-anhydro-D-fructose reductase [Cellulomonas hominis]
MSVHDHRPRFPERPLGVGLLGCGQIARTAHLPAYAAYGVPVVAACDRPGRAADLGAVLPADATAYDDVEQFLADPRVEVVDIATGPVGRVELVERCLAAGKHVLAQKPVVATLDDLAVLEDVAARAAGSGQRVAVNQNGRWAPAWRVTTQLIRSGAVGDVVGVTHLHDKPLPPIAGTPFDDLDHMLLADYLVHWFDITRCWLEGARVETVMAQDSRVPGQPADARNPWHASVHVGTAGGASASIRVVGDARTRDGGCPFWVHGTRGTIRGSILLGSDRVALEADGTTTTYALDGQWFVDGFAGAMGELQCAVVEGREPENGVAHVAGSVRLGAAALAAVRAGTPVTGLGLDLPGVPR